MREHAACLEKALKLAQLEMELSLLRQFLSQSHQPACCVNVVLQTQCPLICPTLMPAQHLKFCPHCVFALIPKLSPVSPVVGFSADQVIFSIPPSCRELQDTPCRRHGLARDAAGNLTALPVAFCYSKGGCIARQGDQVETLTACRQWPPRLVLSSHKVIQVPWTMPR